MLLNADGINQAVVLQLHLTIVNTTPTFLYLRGRAKTIREISEKLK
ncbi:hypothetical protein ACE1B6_11245 [Aerosakkonemataceae cyanobacterium BLCC-F154]|uniref:Uncharacterized protein n=1 Tax=Floridaenema fluviatile BLCC-F154 TaxID=3153640 RepID=A0ABV4YCH7_9CYAN